ncbi:hypothetical protein P8605_06000, partial [Streptomyces sp. T-3]|nr:hypothetical protein [Streptomyces sp. T-3]
CYWMPAARTPEVLHHTERAWTLSLERHAQGRSWLPTEEHLLGYPLNRMRVTDLRPYVRRIWTSARTRTVDGTERAVPLWHLPAEKQRGFQALHPVATDRRSWFWRADGAEFAARAGRAMSVTSRTPRKWLTDLAGRGAERASGLVSAR